MSHRRLLYVIAFAFLSFNALLHATSSRDCRKALETSSVQIVSTKPSDLNEINEIQHSILLKNHLSGDFGFYESLETDEYLSIGIRSPFSLVARIHGKAAGYFLLHEIHDLSKADADDSHVRRIQKLLADLNLKSRDGIYIAGIAVHREANLLYSGLGAKLFDEGIYNLRAQHKKFIALEIALNPFNDHSHRFFVRRGAEHVTSYTDEKDVKWGVFIIPLSEIKQLKP